MFKTNANLKAALAASAIASAPLIVDESAELKRVMKPRPRVRPLEDDAPVQTAAAAPAPRTKKMIDQERYRERRFTGKGGYAAYRHFMIGASHKEIAIWNNKVDQRKRARSADRLERLTMAQKAVGAIRDTFDSLRDFRHAVRNYTVGLVEAR